MKIKHKNILEAAPKLIPCSLDLDPQIKMVDSCDSTMQKLT